MTVTKVECPRCRQALRTGQELPVGAEVKCPYCHTVFRHGSGTSMPVGIAARPLTRKPAPTPALAAAAATAPTAASGSLTRGLIVVAFLLAVSGGGGFLVYLCFHRAHANPATPQAVPLPEEFAAEALAVPEPALKTKQAAKQLSKPLVALAPEDEKEVESLVRNGVAWLKKAQNGNGTWSGGQLDHEYVAFGGLTLLECGMPASDPAVVKAAQFVRQAADGVTRTYGLSLYLLFLCKLNQPADHEIIKLLAMRLIAGQEGDGGWGYSCPPLSAQEALDIHRFSKELGRRSLTEYVQAEPQKWAQ